MAIGVLMGIDDDDGYTLRVARRVARRTGKPIATDAPGILFLEIDGLGLPILRRAIRDGTTPNMARWLAEDTHRLIEWETDLSSQTGREPGRDPARRQRRHPGLPLGRQGDRDDDDVLEPGRLRRDRARSLERPRACWPTAGRAAATCSRAARTRPSSPSAGCPPRRRRTPRYRAFLANGQNVTRTLVLFFWELYLELVAAAQQRRRDVHPRGHRGGSYPLIRAGMCVFVRDLIVYSVLQDMFRGVPAVYATFSSYDEVAHHSGLERPDTVEALRKLDQRFGMIERARRYAPRPYEIVVLSDHGQTQGATFRQRNGYGLDDLVQRSLSQGRVEAVEGGDENAGGVGRALDEATGRGGDGASRSWPGREVIVLGSGNLGLVYLMETPHRLTLEEIRERHPDLIPALCEHPHVGFVLVRSAEDGAVVLGAGGSRRLADGKVEGEDPLAGFPPNAARHLRRTDGFPHVADIMVNSFFDPVTEEGCAFEELISFHGGMGGPQTQPFILHPARLEVAEPLVGAEAVHRLLRGWRTELDGEAAETADAAR